MAAPILFPVPSDTKPLQCWACLQTHSKEVTALGQEGQVETSEVRIIIIANIPVFTYLILIPPLQRDSLRLREIKEFAQYHTVGGLSFKARQAAFSASTLTHLRAYKR